MSSKTKANQRMRECIFRVIDAREPGTVITANEMVGILEEIDSRFWPTPLRVTNLMRMSDRLQYRRNLGGYLVLGVPE
jgi:hypothetical protein